MNWDVIKKISIVGNSGAGKSSLSIRLGGNLGIKVFSIDKIYWMPDWKLKDKSSFKITQDVWLQQNSWIIDGVGYWEKMEMRVSE
jgi:adenylate kinase family enzyme